MLNYPVPHNPMTQPLMQPMVPQRPSPGLGAPPAPGPFDSGQQPGAPGIENFLRLLQGLSLPTAPPASPLASMMQRR